MSVSDAQLGAAMEYIALTDEPEAELLMEVEKAEQKWKTTKDAMFLSYSDKISVASRQAMASVADETQAALEGYLRAKQEHRVVSNKRKRADMTVQVWRSLNANRRQGS